MQGRTVAIVVVLVVILLLLIGFWPFYSQPWMAVVLDRIGGFIGFTVGAVVLLVCQWGMWFDRR